MNLLLGLAKLRNSTEKTPIYQSLIWKLRSLKINSTIFKAHKNENHKKWTISYWLLVAWLLGIIP